MPSERHALNVSPAGCCDIRPLGSDAKSVVAAFGLPWLQLPPRHLAASWPRGGRFPRQRARAPEFARAKGFQLKENRSTARAGSEVASAPHPGSHQNNAAGRGCLSTAFDQDVESGRRQIREPTPRLDKLGGGRPIGRAAVSLWRCFKRSTHTPGPC